MESEGERTATHLTDDRLSFFELVQAIRCAHAEETTVLKTENVALKRRLRMAKADRRRPPCDAA